MSGPVNAGDPLSAAWIACQEGFRLTLTLFPRVRFFVPGFAGIALLLRNGSLINPINDAVIRFNTPLVQPFRNRSESESFFVTENNDRLRMIADQFPNRFFSRLF